jgi:heme exporter protein B
LGGEELREFLKISWWIFLKDLNLEFKTKESLSVMIVFSLLILVILNFSIPRGRVPIHYIIPGLFWVAVSFAGILGFNRSFTIEEEEEAIKGLLLAPVDRGAIFLGKFTMNTLLLVITEVIILPAIIILFNVIPVGSIFSFIISILLVTIGFSLIGTLEGALSVKTRAKELMLPLLFFPVVVPIFLSGIRLISPFFGGESAGSSWWIIVILFDLLYLFLSLLLFDYILEE